MVAAVMEIDSCSFITRDGEAIEGEGVEVFGVVTFSVNDLRRDDCPV